MSHPYRDKALALLRREVQENKGLFILAPLIMAGVFIACLLASVILANSITATGDLVIDILNNERAQSGMNISITIDEGEINHDYVISEQSTDEGADPEDWNFSSEWNFNPQRSEKAEDDSGLLMGSLNPVINGLHCLFLLLLLGISINYLLGTLHNDRRDRSVLFWKSMPVSEAQEVAAKMAAVCLLAPVIYLVVSMFTQLASIGLAMLITWRMDMNPVQTVLDNVDFLSLFRGQVSGLIIWVVWTLPVYAWLLLCSAVARRSPLMLAVGIPTALIVLERLFLDSEYLADAISNHMPHPGIDGGIPMGFYFYEPQWWVLDYTGMLLGLLAAAGLLWATIWFRKHRFEV
jgi:hypothetical protein